MTYEGYHSVFTTSVKTMGGSLWIVMQTFRVFRCGLNTASQLKCELLYTMKCYGTSSFITEDQTISSTILVKTLDFAPNGYWII